MARNVSADVQKELYKPQTSYCFLPLAKIESTELPNTLYFVSNNEDVVSNGETYLKTAFEFKPPAEVDGTPQNASISLDGVDRSIIEIIRSIETPLNITLSVIEANNPDVVEFGEWEFQLRNVTIKASRVEGDLIFQTYLQDNVSTIRYSNINFPGIYG